MSSNRPVRRPSAARPAPRTVARIQETAGELRESRVVGSANGDVEAFLRDHACHPTGCGDGTGVIRGFASAILPPSLNRVSGGDRLSSPACDVRPDGIQKAERYRAHRADSRRPRKRTSPVANRLFTPLKTTTASVVSRPFPPRSDSRCSPTPGVGFADRWRAVNRETDTMDGWRLGCPRLGGAAVFGPTTPPSRNRRPCCSAVTGRQRAGPCGAFPSGARRRSTCRHGHHGMEGRTGVGPVPARGDELRGKAASQLGRLLGGFATVARNRRKN